MASVLLIEPFYTGSHRQLMDLLHSEVPGASLVTMPGKKWPWKARAAALYLSQHIPREHSYRTVFASSVLNLAEMVALRPDLGSTCKILYFHENQLTYPVQANRQRPERDFQFGYNQILSTLVADVVVFNSSYNMETFLGNINSFLKLMPDHRPKRLPDQIRGKCRVFHFPIVFPERYVVVKKKSSEEKSGIEHCCLTPCPVENRLKGNDSENISSAADEQSCGYMEQSGEGEQSCGYMEQSGEGEQSCGYMEQSGEGEQSCGYMEQSGEGEQSCGYMEQSREGVTGSSHSLTMACTCNERDCECKECTTLHKTSDSTRLSQPKQEHQSIEEKVPSETEDNSHVLLETDTLKDCVELHGDGGCSSVKKMKVERPSLHIVWPHRWEHDKNPEAFFKVMYQLRDVGCQFRLSVLGEQYAEVPAVFEEAHTSLKDHIEHWGYQACKEDYYNVLREADVVVSTANHEFFGVAMLEAVHMGCFPLVPNRLVYPELFTKPHLYNTDNQLFKELRYFCNNPHVLRHKQIQVNTDKYSWGLLKSRYLELLAVT